MKPRQLCIFAEGFHEELLAELTSMGITPHDPTVSSVLITQDCLEPAWAQCVWRETETLSIESIKDAQKKLRAISKKWVYFGDRSFRRGALIAEGLNLEKKPLSRVFPSLEHQLNSAPLAAFTLLEPGLLLYSKNLSRPTADGVLEFFENKTHPPSRAYLKLWEALTLLGDHPQVGQQVLDLGSSPGSWSWALAQLGAHVRSIDRSPLEGVAASDRRITFKIGDAFSVVPQKVDWLFSDLICYPDKLYEYVRQWMESGLCHQYVCSIKFAGEPDFAIIAKFKTLPHSRVVHLHHNKNEVTWISHPKL